MTIQNFIRAAEVWRLSVDGSLLEFAAGAFGPAKRFSALSRTMCFGRGEGLPGRVWLEGRPLLLSTLTGAEFRRSEAALAAGYGCAVALPFFSQQRLAAVLVLFCGHDPAAAGALELWHHDARITSDMTLVGGAYGAADPAFATVSQETYLPRGIGLPGLAWQRGQAVFLDDLATSAPAKFLRAEQATAAGMLRGLAIPVGSLAVDRHVVTFLAGRTQPLAQRIERWLPDEGRTRLQRVLAFSELHDGHATTGAELPLGGDATGAVNSALASAFASGVPALSTDPTSERGAPAAAAAAIGATALVAVPVVWEGAVVEVVALYL